MEFYHFIVNFFREGGFFLYPLAAIFVVGVAIAIERFIYLTHRDDEQPPPVGPGGAADQQRQLQAGGRDHLEVASAAIATVLNYGIARLASARRRDDVEKAMDESLLEIIPRMEKRTHYLSALANIGMLTGLLGTVIGLISAFASIAQANPAEKASLLAASISVAMNNTASGLLVRDHAAAGAHVPGSEDDETDRQPGNRRGEVPELGRGASPGSGRRATSTRRPRGRTAHGIA